MTDNTRILSRQAVSQQQRWREYVARLHSSREPFEDQWRVFNEIFAGRAAEDGPPLAWEPDPESLPQTNIGRLMDDLGMTSYGALHHWSVTQRIEFWGEMLGCLRIRIEHEASELVDLSEGVTRPRWLPGARMNIVDSCFGANPEHPAIISGREGSDAIETTTYGELERLVNRFANGLRAHGFQSGDAIALYMPMTPECVVAYLGTVRAGCAVVSIAHSFAAEEVRKRLAIANAVAVVTVESFRRAGRMIPLYEKVRAADAPRTIVIPSKGDSELRLRANDLPYDSIIGHDDEGGSVACDPSHVTNILFSSGTTGTPKAIPWTQLTPIKCAMDGCFHQDIGDDDVVAWPTNIGWMMGPWLIYASLINRATIALYEGAPTGIEFARFIHDAEVSILGVVPSLVRAWQATQGFEAIDWSRIRLFSSTGEPSNQRDYLWLMSRAGYAAPVIEYCGGTEIGGGYITGTIVQAASPATFTTPALGLGMLILNDEATPVAEGGMGEVFLVPPSIGLSQSLLNADHDHVYHAECPAGPNGETLRRHGDQITRLHRGFYRAQGRADDTMNLGGIKVGSLELERVIDHHGKVFESAAIAVQPEGEGPGRLVIYVRTEEGTEAVTLLKDLQEKVAKEINPLFRIHDLVLVDELPRTASNKLMRRKLRVRYLETHGGRPENG